MLTLLAAILLPQTTPQKEDALVSIDMEGTLEQVARALSSKTGIPIRIQRGADEILGADAVRRLRLRDIPARSAVYWLARTFQTHATADDAGDFLLGDRPFRSRFVRRIHDPAGLHFPSWAAPPHVRIHPDTDTFDWTPRRTLDLREKARLVGDLIGTPGAYDLVRRALEWMDLQALEGRQTAFEKAMLELVEKSVPAEKRDAARKILEEFYATVCRFTTGDLLTDIVREHVAPGTWEGDATLERLPDGKLSVVHSPGVQAELEAFLKGLHLIAPRSTLTVEALLLSPDADLEKHALAPIGAQTLARILPPMKPTRRIQVRGLEGSWLQAKAAGKDTVEVLCAAGSLDPRDGMIRLQVSLSLGTMDASEVSLVTFSSALALPNGGAALHHLPGRRLLLIHASATAAATPQSVDVNVFRPDPALVAKLDARGKVPFEFYGTALPEILERFHSETGLNFLLSPSVAGELRVIFRATLSPSAALDLILKPNLAARIHHDAVEIVPAERVPVVTRLLTLRDLATSDGYDGIAQRIKNDVAREHWEEADGKSIWALEDGTLMIRNQPAVLDAVAAYLVELRSRRRVSVALEVAVVAVDSARAAELAGETSLGPVVLDRLLRGDVVERVTLRGEAEVPMEMAWTMRRLPSRQDSRCSLVAQLTPGKDDAAVSLTLKDPHRTRIDLKTTLRIPAGHAGLLRLPDADDRARLLLVRVIP